MALATEGNNAELGNVEHILYLRSSQAVWWPLTWLLMAAWSPSSFLPPLGRVPNNRPMFDTPRYHNKGRAKCNVQQVGRLTVERTVGSTRITTRTAEQENATSETTNNEREQLLSQWRKHDGSPGVSQLVQELDANVLGGRVFDPNNTQNCICEFLWKHRRIWQICFDDVWGRIEEPTSDSSETRTDCDKVMCILNFMSAQFTGMVSHIEATSIPHSEPRYIVLQSSTAN